MLLGLREVVEAGERGGARSARLGRPRAAFSLWPLGVEASTAGAGASLAGVAGGGGASSSMGESGGGGISVPSVKLKLRGASAGSSNRLPLTLAGIFDIVGFSDGLSSVCLGTRRACEGGGQRWRCVLY